MNLDSESQIEAKRSDRENHPPSGKGDEEHQFGNGIEPLDRFFADAILKRAGLHSEESALALGRLMHRSRAGNLCVKKEDLGKAIESLPSTIVTEGNALFPKAPIVRYKDCYYLQKNWVCETYILQHALRLRRNPAPSYFDRNAFEENLSKFAEKLLPGQIAAIRAVLGQSLSLICGGPGTGKTYTAAHLVKLLSSSLNRQEKKDFRVCVAAPTGKAASHLHAALQGQGCFDPALHIETFTLHRLLKLQPGSNRLFAGGRIDADLIIVDEASMIDTLLLAHLLEAVGEETLLVLIGDPDQLPPIEAGSLFAEMGALFGIALAQCMRTEDSHLQALAQAVKQGDFGTFSQLWTPHSEPVSADLLYSRIDPVFLATLPDPRFCLEKYSRFCILNAIRQGSDGADALNTQIFQILQKKDKWWAAPILATVNDSFCEIYNGMSGILIGQNMRVEAAYFPDLATGEMRRFATPPPYELAFCLSIHKAQGSEFDEILALFPQGSEHFGREALYTAITRAKNNIEIRGEPETLQGMLLSTSRMMSSFSARALDLSAAS